MLKNLFEGVLLDAYGLFIPYTFTRPELIKRLEEYEIPMIPTSSFRWAVYVESEMLGSHIPCSVAFVFSGSKMTVVCITALPGAGAPERVFYILQERLEILLGKRGKVPFLQQLFGGDTREYKWEMGGLNIEHTLVDRCGLVDSTYVYIN